MLRRTKFHQCFPQQRTSARQFFLVVSVVDLSPSSKRNGTFFPNRETSKINGQETEDRSSGRVTTAASRTRFSEPGPESSTGGNILCMHTRTAPRRAHNEAFRLMHYPYRQSRAPKAQHTIPRATCTAAQGNETWRRPERVAAIGGLKAVTNESVFPSFCSLFPFPFPGNTLRSSRRTGEKLK